MQAITFGREQLRRGPEFIERSVYELWHMTALPECLHVKNDAFRFVYACLS